MLKLSQLRIYCTNEMITITIDGLMNSKCWYRLLLGCQWCRHRTNPASDMKLDCLRGENSNCTNPQKQCDTTLTVDKILQRLSSAKTGLGDTQSQPQPFCTFSNQPGPSALHHSASTRATSFVRLSALKNLGIINVVGPLVVS